MCIRDRHQTGCATIALQYSSSAGDSTHAPNIQSDTGWSSNQAILLSQSKVMRLRNQDFRPVCTIWLQQPNSTDGRKWCNGDRRDTIYRVPTRLIDCACAPSWRLCPDTLDRLTPPALVYHYHCLLYTSDAADERSSVDLGGRPIIKKKNKRINELTNIPYKERHN